MTVNDPMTTNPYLGLTLDAAKRLATQSLAQAGFETPKLDARILLLSATGLEHADLIVKGGEALTLAQAETFAALVARRLSGEPIDHILGHREFYGRSFKVSKDVLSPRPETEGLIDQALVLYGEESDIKCLDLGTGSGAIILTLLAERPNWTGLGVDLSAAALEIASENAHRHGLEGRVSFLQSSWLDGVDEQFDLIVSNPPYIDKTHMERLSREVKDYDPSLALYGGPDGLEAYRAIINQAPHYLKQNGRLILEIGYDQKQTVSNLLDTGPFTDIDCHMDLAGLDRIITAKANVM
ncbi:MAG: peptide chain release factor N(5)-glutamine methyltransferase [Maricaulaceae bacterium]